MMALDRLKDTLGQLPSKAGNLTTEDAYHPLDPLSESEIAIAVDVVLKKQSDLIFNSVTLLEPEKELLKKYIESQDTPFVMSPELLMSLPVAKATRPTMFWSMLERKLSSGWMHLRIKLLDLGCACDDVSEGDGLVRCPADRDLLG